MKYKFYRVWFCFNGYEGFHFRIDPLIVWKETRSYYHFMLTNKDKCLHPYPKERLGQHSFRSNSFHESTEYKHHDVICTSIKECKEYIRCESEFLLKEIKRTIKAFKKQLPNIKKIAKNPNEVNKYTEYFTPRSKK